MQGLTQVVGGGLRTQFRPERVYDLLTVETVTMRQGEQLHKARRLPEPPLAVLDDSRARRDPKAAQQPYSDRLGPHHTVNASRMTHPILVLPREQRFPRYRLLILLQE